MHRPPVECTNSADAFEVLQGPTSKKRKDFPGTPSGRASGFGWARTTAPRAIHFGRSQSGRATDKIAISAGRKCIPVLQVMRGEEAGERLPEAKIPVPPINIVPLRRARFLRRDFQMFSGSLPEQHRTLLVLLLGELGRGGMRFLYSAGAWWAFLFHLYTPLPTLSRFSGLSLFSLALVMPTMRAEREAKIFS